MEEWKTGGWAKTRERNWEIRARED